MDKEIMQKLSLRAQKTGIDNPPRKIPRYIIADKPLEEGLSAFPFNLDKAAAGQGYIKCF